MPVRDCFEQGQTTSKCCQSKDRGCNLYDGPCTEDSHCKSGSCGYKGLCPQMIYPWETLHPNVADIRCCSEKYHSMDTPSNLINIKS